MNTYGGGRDKKSGRNPLAGILFTHALVRRPRQNPLGKALAPEVVDALYFGMTPARLRRDHVPSHLLVSCGSSRARYARVDEIDRESTLPLAVHRVRPGGSVDSYEAGGEALAGEPPTWPIDFNREIRPILFNACLACRGRGCRETERGQQAVAARRSGRGVRRPRGYAAIVRGQPRRR